MISPNEIKQKAEKWWNDGSFLTCELRGQTFFPKSIYGIKPNKPSEDLESLSQIKKEQELLKKGSKVAIGSGYSLKWEKRRSRLIGENEFITDIYFESQADYLRFIGKEKAFKLFQTNTNLLRDQLPELEEWLVNNPLKILEYSTDWVKLLSVVSYFKTEHIPGKYYVREIPVDVDTKFIEQHESIVRNLLDALIPEMVNKDEKSFAKRYGLLYSQPLVRIRFLDPKLHILKNVSDMSIPVNQISSIEIQNAERIFIAENLMNFLTIPAMSNSIALWSGGGFNIQHLKDITWVINLQIYYWGDIDSHGLQILSQCREYFPNTKALMMDFKTLNHFEHVCGKGKKTTVKNLPGLTTEELELFNWVNTNGIRLEQEKIPQQFVLEVFGQIH